MIDREIMTEPVCCKCGAKLRKDQVDTWNLLWKSGLRKFGMECSKCFKGLPERKRKPKKSKNYSFY